jgi:hypothetical protein
MFLFPLGFKVRPTEKCINERKITPAGLSNFLKLTNTKASSTLYQLRRNNDRDVPKNQQSSNVFQVNYSKFVQALSLKSFINTPRPCAYQSLMLEKTPIEYFKGSQTITYNIAK